MNFRFLPSAFLCVLCGSLTAAEPIDREALVRRHTVRIDRHDPMSPLSVGNGGFAFTVDMTGLQTFPAAFSTGILLGTQSDWGWHSDPNPEGFSNDDVYRPYPVNGRDIPYLDGKGPAGAKPAATSRTARAIAWLRQNPHRLHLGGLGFVLKKADGSAAGIGDVTNIAQELDLWTGTIRSRFEIDGTPVTVETVCHPDRDAIAARIASPGLASGRVAVQLAFPGPNADWRVPYDWKAEKRHQTTAETNGMRCTFARTLDADRYTAALAWNAGTLVHTATHTWTLTASGAVLEVSLGFPEAAPAFASAREASAQHWKTFWSTGGAVDFSGSTDPRAAELERRVVLSQYLTAIQCAGDMPPQETGLTQNSWHGKAHLEMHWWHAAHFALWNRTDLLERSLPWYTKILPAARAAAAKQGYAGARWPKMVGPEGRDSPSDVGVFLIWQQPHPIFYAELVRRQKPGRETLANYRAVIEATADFMASYAFFDTNTQRYVLGPALIPAQENYGPHRAGLLNPTYELAYWQWALDTANRWREALGEPRNTNWDAVARGLAKPAVRDGRYLAIETTPFLDYIDHPSMLMAWGWTPPTALIDPQIMNRTLDDTLANWKWPHTWGWDYPVVAMTAARLGRPADAVDALLMNTPKNNHLRNGHNEQRGNLQLYLPGNGGLLYAIAFMAAGWDGAPATPAPGFPREGWKVRCEGLEKAP